MESLLSYFRSSSVEERGSRRKRIEEEKKKGGFCLWNLLTVDGRGELRVPGRKKKRRRGTKDRNSWLNRFFTEERKLNRDGGKKCVRTEY